MSDSVWRTIHLCALLLAAFPVLAQTPPAPSSCGALANAYGPFDYRTQRQRLMIVEQYHFQPHIEALIRPAGASKADLGGNLDYTLRASPNHHRALIALVRYAEREKSTRVVGADYSVDCYFDRAIRFAADDPIVRMIFAGYLGRQGRLDQAERQLEVAASLSGDNPFTVSNVGAVYFELKRYDKALEFDHRAKALGWQRKELENLLREAGKWVDPVPVAPAAASAPASAGSAPPTTSPDAAAAAASAAPGVSARRP